jgi:hypothetical protein
MNSFGANCENVSNNSQQTCFKNSLDQKKESLESMQCTFGVAQ